jgi:ribosomal protein S18 acetylase RimI-like enzyme
MKSFDVRVRWMLKQDGPAVRSIERSIFHDPWDEEDFSYFLQRRYTTGKVALVDDLVVGYMVYVSGITKLTWSILNLGVLEDFQRMGVGKALVDSFKARARKPTERFPEGRMVSALVDERNLEAQMFFRSQGFRVDRICKNHYEDSWGELSDGYRFTWVPDVMAGLPGHDTTDALSEKGEEDGSTA